MLFQLLYQVLELNCRIILISTSNSRFWLEILRPGFFNLLEMRDSGIVRAAFCDCLSEIGDDVIGRIPTEKRNLCVTYLLRQCRDDDHRVIASAFRGIGMIVTLPACQSDNAFLVCFLCLYYTMRSFASPIIEYSNQYKSIRTILDPCQTTLNVTLQRTVSFHEG